MLTIFRYTLSRARGPILGWGIGLALYGAYIVGFYDTLLGMQAQFQELLASYPPELLAFIGGVSDLFTPAGYLNSYLFSYMPLIMGIYAVIAGSGLIVGDEERGRLDLVMGHPISRTAFFFGRLLAFCATLTAILGVTWLGFILGESGTTLDLGAGEIMLPFLSLLGLLILFGTLGLLLSMALPSRGLAAAGSGLVLVASFFLTMLAAMDTRLETLANFSPFSYYQGGLAINGMQWSWLAGLLGGSLVFMLIAWWLFQRREIRVGGERSWRVPGLPLGSRD